MPGFQCLSISGACLAHPAVALATSRCGGIGILDFQFCADLERGVHNLRQLRASAGSRGRIGVRATVAQLHQLIEVLVEEVRTVWVVVAVGDATPDAVGAALDKLAKHLAWNVLVEVTSASQLESLKPRAFAGVIAKGYEAGGWVGEDTAFVLTQKLLEQGISNVFVQGGVGLYSAAACRAAGAAGVVLDDQLLLMPESGLSAEMQRHLNGLVGNETVVHGERLGLGLRVLSRPGFRAAAALGEAAARLDDQGGGVNEWRRAAATLVGWQSADETAWPIGQAVGFAAAYRDRFKTTGRLVQALIEGSSRQVQTAARLQALAPDAPLARSHGTRYPILQGPMTRVSDCARFAAAVAEAGALPLLALALMQPEQVESLLSETKALLGDRPWGVGILGFVPQQVREAQFEVIVRIKPSYALIAGGRPDQAERFEAAGIPAYIHVPSPALLRMFLEQGARRFVFEGRECGGHVGPLSSFVLWEHAVSVLLEAVRPGAEQEIHAIFAGGIHDARSAAMVGALVAPLAERGINVGVLMGSAYLFTREIVTSGAIVPAFQEQALACRETVTLETGQGHASRCAVTEFAHEFYRTRRALRGAGRSADEVRDSLEDLSLGRLRAASKGELRDPAGELRQLGPAAQVQEGMYMIGQVATLRHAPLTLADLHRQVSEDGQALLQAHAPPAAVSNLARPTDIAVIGIGTLLPKAYHPEQFWSNIVAKLDAITEIPLQRWDWRLYFDEDRRARDKVYSKWGGFLDELEFDPVRFGIPPNSVRSIDPIQLLGLEVVRRALEDAGYSEGGLDNEHTSVILGASGGLGDLGLQYGLRSELPRFSEVIPDQVWDRLPEWTEESFAGTLLNVVSGRIANRFNFGGLNCTVDAACASSLSAIHLAVAELESGRSNTVVAGGVDTVQSPFGYLCFSKTQALTPRGRARTFDRDSDGIVISEGLAVVVLKRLADAERDGDRVYAVIKATGGSSDGKALGLTAPLPEGQMRALRRAYQRAGFGPNTLGLIEAHGTGTAVGDRAEAETVVRTLREHGTPARECAIGSVKTLIGHTKATAGVAGLIKVALALHHKVLPPHCNVTNPIEPIADPTSPVYLCKEALPWVRHPDHPRRGAVSAFGFGGTNFHAVLEEYGGDLRPSAAPPGARDWPFELLVLRGQAEADLRKQLETLQAAVQAGAAPRLADLAFSLALRADDRRDAALTLAIVVHGLEHLAQSLSTVLAQPRLAGAVLPPNVVFGERLKDPTLAFVFPGQGAQYPEMGREAMMFFPELRRALEVADSQLQHCFAQRLSRYIFPPSAFNDADEAENLKRITNTHVAQPAIGTLAAGFLDLLARLGLTPAMVAGHSYGEYAALHAAGAIGREAFVEISEIRGRVMAEAGKAADAGAMAAIQGDREKVAALLRAYPDVGIANHNSPSQCVISGATQSVKLAAEALTHQGFGARLLPVSAAFHSPLVAGAQPLLDAAIGRLGLRQPSVPLYSNTTARPYPSTPADMQALLARHMLSPVEFVDQIRNMYDDGARVFVELGPKTMLARMIGQTLEGRQHVAVCIGGGGDLRGTLLALGTLTASGAPLSLRALFNDRLVQKLNLDRLAETTARKPLSATAWYLTGGGLRKPTEPAVRTGKQVALTIETRPREHAHFLDQLAAERAASSATPMTPAQPAPAPSAALAAPATFAPATQVGEAWSAYQQTMRQFLNLQEQVMRQYLGGPGAASGMASMAVATLAAPKASVPAAPVPADRATAPTAAALVKPAPDSTVASGPGREELSQLLLNLVSERTGYPMEMLGMTQDLEAELGIDSIKRVEILGALHQQLPAAMGEAVRGSMEQLTRVKTMAALLDRLLETAPAAAAAAPAQPAAAVTVASGPGREELSQLLLNLVSERTGYPMEMLGMTQDLEAELGIDSIKRVEILGALHQQLPAAMGEAVRGSMEQLTRVKTMAALVDRLVEISTPQPAPAPAALAPSPTVSPTRTEPPAGEIEPSRTPRYVIAPRAAPLPAVSVAHLSGLYLVLGGPPALAAIVLDSLRKRGAAAHGIDQTTLADATRVAEHVEALRATAGPVAGVVHLAGLAVAGVPESLQVWRAMAAVQTKSLFELLKYCAGDLTRGGHVVAATAFGGRFGRDGHATATSATAAGVNGLLKTLAFEWPDATFKVVDFDPTASGDSVAAALIQELLTGDREVEVGFAEGSRYVFAVTAAPFPQPRPELHRLEDHSVILVTAGARGITAEVVSRLARPTFTLVVIGRLPHPGAAQDRFSTMATAAELRQGLLMDARQRGEAVTPVEVERRVQDVLRAREIARNLAKLKESGAQIEYFAVDVRDERAFGAAIDGIYARHGRLDAVIHGAGIIEDKLLADKSTQSFERVFDTKVDSAFILGRYLRPEGLRLVVFFTSVAGVFGNRGQSDYAAANEVVNRLGMQLEQRWRHTRVVAINWGPWDNPGMASEEVRRQFRDRGIVPISTVEGCRFFVDEIRHGLRGEVEVVAGEGPWSPGPGGSSEATAPIAAPMVLLRGRPHVQPNGTVLLEHRIGLASEPFLEDHRLDQRPVLPAAAALELMAEFVQAAWPELHVSEVRSLSVLRGIALEPGADKALVLSAKTSSHAEADSVQVSVEILESKTRVSCYRAFVTLPARSVFLRLRSVCSSSWIVSSCSM